METSNKARPKKKFNDGSSSSKEDSDGSNNPFIFNNTTDEYKNDPLRNILLYHHNIAPDNLLIIKYEGKGNCLYLYISYHVLIILNIIYR